MNHKESQIHIEVRRVVTVALGLLIWTATARSQSDCKPYLIDPTDTTGSAFMLQVGVVSEDEMDETQQEKTALMNRKLEIEELISDHKNMLNSVRSCFRNCPLGGGSVESNVAFRRCQQGCKSEAVGYIQEFWRRWPEARKGVGVSVGDYGEFTITDSRGEESADAKNQFYIAPLYVELNSINSKLSVASKRKPVRRPVSLMAAISDQDSRTNKSLDGMFAWPLDAAAGGSKMRALILVVGMDWSDIIEIVGEFTPGNEREPWNWVRFQSPLVEAKRFFESLVNNRRIIVSIESGVILQFTILIDESGQRALSCIRRDHGL